MIASKPYVLTFGICTLILGSSAVLAQRPGTPQTGQAIYQQHCVRCLGKALDGKGPDTASLGVPPANFHSAHSRTKDDIELWLTIQRGRMFTAMHNWSDELGDDQISDVVTYIRSVVPHAEP
jgi:mono/diheme cytochrome c family protein